MKNENTLSLIPVLIPTPKSKIYLNKTHRVITTENLEGIFLKRISISQLYLTSNREIKEDDWVLLYGSEVDKVIAPIVGFAIKTSKKLSNFNDSKPLKIEFTNDSALISDGVPALPDKALMTEPSKLPKYKMTFEIDLLEEFVKRYNAHNKKLFYVEELADKYRHKHPKGNSDIMLAFEDGYNECLENTSDMFTWEDMRILWDYFIDGHYGLNGKQDEITFKEYIDNLKSVKEKKSEIELYCELHPRPITCGHNEIGEEGKDYEWSVEPFEGQAQIYFK